MRTSTVVWILIIGVVIIGALWYFSSMPALQPTTTNTETTTPSGTTNSTSTASTSTQTGTPIPMTVTYTASGFSPAVVTVPVGTTVTFANDGGPNMWVASDPHPVHTDYDGTSRTDHCPDVNGTAFDQCAPGETFSFTFKKAGTWKYHNHMNSRDTGTIVVQ